MRTKLYLSLFAILALPARALCSDLLNVTATGGSNPDGSVPLLIQRINLDTGSSSNLLNFNSPYGTCAGCSFYDEYEGKLYIGGSAGYSIYDVESNSVINKSKPSGVVNAPYPWNGSAVISDQGNGKIQIGNSSNGVTIDIDGINVDGNPLINIKNGDEIHIGENSLITVEENGIQKLYAKDAAGNAIPINITEGTKLLIDGVEVTPGDSVQVEENRKNITTNQKNITTNQKNITTNQKNITTNQKNISANRQNINDLGFGVAGATALSTAMTALPTVANDSPVSCGVGTGGYSNRYAMSVGCAFKTTERLSFNAGGSYVFGGAADYGNSSLSNVAGRAGFVFKLGEIKKPASSNNEQLQSQLDEVKEKNIAIQTENASIRSLNQELLARLERLEAIALGNLSTTTTVSFK